LEFGCCEGGRGVNIQQTLINDEEVYECWSTYTYDGNHPGQSHQVSCSQSYPRASHVLEGYKRRKRRLALLPFRLNRLSHGLSRKQSIQLGWHRSWQLDIVSQSE
jgi:hypothetical protein